MAGRRRGGVAFFATSTLQGHSPGDGHFLYILRRVIRPGDCTGGEEQESGSALFEQVSLLMYIRSSSHMLYDNACCSLRYVIVPDRELESTANMFSTIEPRAVALGRTSFGTAASTAAAYLRQVRPLLSCSTCRSSHQYAGVKALVPLLCHIKTWWRAATRRFAACVAADAYASSRRLVCLLRSAKNGDNCAVYSAMSCAFCDNRNLARVGSEGPTQGSARKLVPHPSSHREPHLDQISPD